MRFTTTVRPTAAQKCQPITLNTSFGPIRVTAVHGVGYDVTAKTSFGFIKSQASITVNGQVGRDSLNGKIGAGGCAMRLTDQAEPSIS